jgi:PAS domain S-box-containing protein
METGNLFKPFRIRDKLLVSYLAVIIPILAVGGLVVYSLAKETIEKNIESELNNSTGAIYNMVRTAADVSIKNRLRAIAEKNREIVRSVYGRFEAGDLLRSEAENTIRSILLSQTIGRTGYIYCINDRGIATVHPEPLVQGDNFSHFAFIQEQIRKKEGYIEYQWKNPGDPEPKPKALYMTYFEPLNWIISVSTYREEFSELIHVDDFRKSILPMRFGKSGYSYVIDSVGNAVIHPLVEGANILRNPQIEDGFLREMLRRKNGTMTYDWKNPGEKIPRKKIVKFNYIPEYEWLVASACYMDEMYEPLRNIRNIIFLTALGSLALFTFLTVLISGSITLPLTRLRDYFSRGMAGDFSVRMAHRSRDEVGQLADYFNNFMERLEEYEGNLKGEISDRLQAEEALRQSESKYRQLFEMESDALFLVENPTGHILEANSAAIGLYGYSREELLQMKNTDLSAEPDATGAAIQLSLPRVGIRQHRKKDGAVFPVEITGRNFSFHGGEVQVAAIRDITERVRTEKENMALQAKLQEAIKMEALGALAGGIAHDFNNILGAMLGYTELTLYQSSRRNPKLKNLNKVLEAGYRAKDLIRQILTFSRNTEPKKAPIQIAPIIKETVRLLRSTTPPSIQIRKKLQYPSGTVLADPTQIHQVLMNLCTNAVQAMEETGGVLEIGLEEIDLTRNAEPDRYPDLEPGLYVLLSVEDTGEGINPTVVDRIFEPYFTTKSEGRGTGIGLSVVHGIVKDHQGTIRVESRHGRGTRMEVLIPETSSCAAPRKHGPLKPLAPGKERILFVDDEIFLTELSRQTLTPLGYGVHTETDARSALNTFCERPETFDIVFTDLVMPHMPGNQLAREILRVRPDIPVILCTGFSDRISPEKANQIGVSGYLLKPISAHDLVETIRRLSDTDKPDQAHPVKEKEPA